MYELLYYSEAAENLTEKDIQDILNAARTFNPKHGITGCLIFYQGEFLQILEGEREQVLRLFHKIKKDPRHHNVSILLEEDHKQTRSFKDWNMAYHPMEIKELEEFNRKVFINNILSLGALAEKPSDVSELFLYTSRLMVS